MSNREEDHVGQWGLPPDFEMPCAREIELELALGSDGWQSLLRPDGPQRELRAPDALRDPARRAF